MKRLFVIIATVIGIFIIMGIFSKGFCDFFNCQLSITDFGMEIIIALLMATFLVVVIDIHLTKYKFWRFCKIVKVKLNINFQTRLSIQAHADSSQKNSIREAILFMQNNENLMFGALKIERIVAIQSRLKLYQQGLECKPDISYQVYEAFDEYLQSLLIRNKPPFYIGLAAKYFGGF